jgi:chromosome segregation ATPase
MSTALDNDLFLVHEDRIEKLGATVMESAKQIAEVQSTIKHLEDKIDTQFSYIGEKIDRLSDGIEKQDLKLELVNKRIDEVEVAATTSSAFFQVISKIGFYALTAALGAAASLVVAHFAK